ncbi:MAG: 4-hydroxybenzoate octaprenyltransferase [Legionellaceae bacterium]|nr:4-hydroxybenzoate octaprenyltransferase [Legionellaceae bacterium]
MFARKWARYWQLMRFDKPIGILLLWYPVAWALWLAAEGHPPLDLLFIFLLGTIVMRAAGCVINDIADRHIDRRVQRTRNRPLTTGELGVLQALFCFVFLLVLALLLLLTLPPACIKWAVAAVGITILYPFSKRFLSAPQLILGLAFSMAIPMVYTALSVPLSWNTWTLVLINLTWVVAYDTEYAMVDRQDDRHIGVRSTAILFGKADRAVIALLFFSGQMMWLVLAFWNAFSLFFYGFWVLANFVLVWQLILIYHRQPEDCFRAFLWNGWYGLSMWLALLVHYLQ